MKQDLSFNHFLAIVQGVAEKWGRMDIVQTLELQRGECPLFGNGMIESSHAVRFVMAVEVELRCQRIPIGHGVPSDIIAELSSMSSFYREVCMSAGLREVYVEQVSSVAA